MKNTACAWLLAALSAAGAVSPFADKGAVSYSSLRDDQGKLIELPWGQLKPNDFGPRTVDFDCTGVRQLRPAPPAGVHPRIYFGPDDLPDLRRRLKETQCGRAAWKNLLCWTEMMKGRYDDTADYAKPDVWKGSFGGLHSRVPLFRLGVPREGKSAYNHSARAAEIYRQLVDGSAASFPSYYWNVFALEAFRCLVENDTPAAKDLARAVTTAMRLDQVAREAQRRTKGESGAPEQPVGGFQLAFTYDFLFNWLTPAQRRAMHDELAECTWRHDNYGTFNEACASRSNWATFSYWLFEVLAIEGEPGFNELKVRGMYRGWRNLLTYGWFQSGATFEGEAKNQLGMDGIIPFAMREKMYGFQDLCGHPYLRAYARNFLPLSVLPTQDGFIKYDLLGGAHGRPMAPDCLGLKFMLPEDKVIDWVYRSAVGENYENVPDRCDGYRNDLLYFLCYASDFEPANNDPGKLNLGNTFFCGERALLMTRSGWDKDALMLNLHTRQANGGHPFADRNAIALCGAGRVWSPPGYASFASPENSLVVVDGKTQQLNVPGRMIDFQEAPLATFAVGDASYPWNWNWKVLNGKRRPYHRDDVAAGRIDIPAGWSKELHSVNDFSFLKLPFDYLNRPMFEQAHWLAPAGYLSPVVRQPGYPVQKAFRTAGLVRGPRPYALVLDDIQKDETVHRYDWTLALEPDLQIAKVETRGEHELDILLTGASEPERNSPRPRMSFPPAFSGTVPDGQPMLLVRVLNRNTTRAAEPTIVELPNATDPKKYGTVRRLLIPAEAVSPEFKVLLYPYHSGAPLPQTRWNSAHNTVTVELGGVRDELEFTPAKSGKTNLILRRASQVVLHVNRESQPLE